MKKLTFWAGATVILALTANAQVTNTNISQLSARVHVRCLSTNATGGVTNETAGNWHFINDCLASSGITDTNGVRLVFNVTNSLLAVVNSNGDFICSPLSLEGGVLITNAPSGTGTNTNHVVVHGLWYAFEPSTNVAVGTLLGTEKYTYRTNGTLANFSFLGHFAFAEAASGTNGPMICRGSIAVGDVDFNRDGREHHDHDCDFDHDRDHDHDFDHGHRPDFDNGHDNRGGQSNNGKNPNSRGNDNGNKGRGH